MDVAVPAPGLVALDQAEEGVVFNPGQRLGRVLHRIGIVPICVYDFIFELRELFFLLEALGGLHTGVEFVQALVDRLNIFVEFFLDFPALLSVFRVFVYSIQYLAELFGLFLLALILFLFAGVALVEILLDLCKAPPQKYQGAGRNDKLR